MERPGLAMMFHLFEDDTAATEREDTSKREKEVGKLENAGGREKTEGGGREASYIDPESMRWIPIDARAPGTETKGLKPPGRRKDGRRKGKGDKGRERRRTTGKNLATDS